MIMDNLQEPAHRIPPPLGEAMHAGMEGVADGLRLTARSAVLWDCRPTWTIARRRPDDDMFMLVLRGRMWARTERGRCEGGPGMCVHWRRDRWHEAGALGGAVQVISVHYTAILADGMHFSVRIGMPDHVQDEALGRLHGLCLDACRIHASQPFCWQARLDSAVAGALFHLVDRHAGACRPIASDAGSLAALERVRPALELMQTDTGGRVGMALLARRCGLSVAHFRRVFTSGVGRSPRDHQQRLRMERGAELLRDRSRQVDQVAELCGFQNYRSFSACFRRRYGATPRTWRRSEHI